MALTTMRLATRTGLPRAARREAAIDASGNGITALRLGLAVWVLVMHVWPAGGFGTDPLRALTGDRLDGGGSAAVWGFFGLSGYLLAISRAHLSARAFAWRRALRILPAYWVCILLTSALVGSWYVEATASPLGWIGAPGWDGFALNPTNLVNASLWTLPLELSCYIVLALIPGRALRITAPLLAVTFLASALSGGVGFAEWQPPIFAFTVGLVIALWRVPLQGSVALACALLAFISVGSPVGTMIAAAGLAYAFLWLGLWLPFRWTADLSYGTYIYAFPVTQLLILAGTARFGPIALALTAGPVTLALAAASWHLVERPALSLKAISIVDLTEPRRLMLGPPEGRSARRR
ncbi:MAG TPA: acyltransferase [Candidatus Limnocylindrales bacterium]|nr:acyltransferase [Candidatus Limnocylindrales bacterium]